MTKSDIDIFVVCESRSGSHLVASFLGSHPGIYNHEEQIKERPSGDEMQLMIQHYQYWSPRYKEKKIIHLVRHNLWDLAVSKCIVVGKKQARFHYSKKKKIEIEVDRDRVVEYIHTYKEMQEKMMKKVTGPNVFPLSYEEITRGKSVSEMSREIAEPLLRFLELKYEKLTTHHKKPKYIIKYT